LFGPILVAQSGELVRRVVEAAPAPTHDPTQVSAGRRRPADWHLFTIDVEGAALHDYDTQEDVHHVKKWTPALGSEALDALDHDLALSHLPLMDGG
jgi:hypothetical protein